MQATVQLAGLIQQKRQLLTELNAVARRQIEIIDRGETAQLLKLLAGKQELIARLQDVERKLAPFREQDPDARSWASPADRSRCADEAAECNRLLEALMRQERQSEEKMTTRRNEVARQLQQMNTAGQARGAYQQHQGPRAGRSSLPPGSDRQSDLSGRLDLVADS